MKNREIIEEINDQKLYLRKISLGDSEFFFTSLKEEAVSKFLSLGPLTSKEHSKKLLKNYLKYWNKNTQFNYIIEIKNDDNIKKIGSISIWNISWLHKRAEIGIWINPKYWSMGFSKKALNMIKYVASNHLNLNRLEAHIAVDNQKSINLFVKCGFIKEGILKAYLNLKGNYHDAVILAHINKNFFKK